MAGIVSYGAYVPLYRIKIEEIAEAHGRDSDFIKKELFIEEKSVPAIDEDSLTMGIDASLNALKSADLGDKKIGAVYCGSESPVYAVKPNASMIGEILGFNKNYTSADIEFACKAGTAAMQMVFGLVESKFIDYGIAVGSDTAQSSPDDILEYAASSGAASFIIGNKEEEIIAELEEMHSISSDTPDFWRRNLQRHPRHAGRFTGEPAYFSHVIECTQSLMKKTNITVSDIDHVAFHTPNGKFPLRAGKILGFSEKQMENNLIVTKIGNTYSAASMLVLSSILDRAKPGERILVTSFGSGAGSDSFLFKVTQNIKKLKRAKTTQHYIDNKESVSYSRYIKNNLNI